MRRNLSLMITRRDAIRAAALTLVAAVTGSSLSAKDAPAAVTTAPATPAAPAPTGPFVLPPLPYPADALEPFIDARTMTIHHDKHHAAYVNNANKALVGDDELSKLSAEDILKRLGSIPDPLRTALRNNVGGHFNHSLFWQTLKKDGGQPTGKLAKQINSTFGSHDAFQKQFDDAALKIFGSGWAWLSLTPTKKLVIETTANQDNPISHGNVPLLGLDVWEHAYYLKYQNVRADYIAAFSKIINWDFVASRLAAT